MTELILHHYANSPFSEKVRLVLGYKQLNWSSVLVPSIMPKPDVQALTGGYRRTPFLQIGADIYCDTALICDVLEDLAPAPSLYPSVTKGVARVLAQWADDRLFWAAMAYNFSPAGMAQLFGGAPDAPPEKWGGIARAFGEDRGQMRAGMARMPWADAAVAYKSYLRRLASMLEGNHFLLGAQPCIADFSAYHPLWFTRHMTPVMAGVLNATPAVLAWMDRMAACAGPAGETKTALQAIAVCAEAGAHAPVDPYFQDDHGIPLGSTVQICAESFGTEVTEGVLLAATRTRYTLQRHDGRAGTVHVHFPRLGYILKKVES